MSISLWVERPPGARTAAREFLPREEVRFAGQVKLWVAQPFVTVTISLKDGLGALRDQWIVKTNWQGMYWGDGGLPDKPGSYTAQAVWDPLVGAPEASTPLAFVVTQVPAGVGPEINGDVSPEKVKVPGQAKLTCSVYLDGRPEPDVPVQFYMWTPTAEPLQTTAVTDSRGIAWAMLTVNQLGQWTVVINVPKYGFSKYWHVQGMAEEPPEEGSTPPPAAGFKLPEWALPVAIAAGAGLVLVIALGGRR